MSDRSGYEPDLIQDGVTGAVFLFGDIEALSAKMLAIKSEQKCRMMGICARTQIIERYSEKKGGRGTLRADTMINRKRSLRVRIK